MQAGVESEFFHLPWKNDATLYLTQDILLKNVSFLRELLHLYFRKWLNIIISQKNLLLLVIGRSKKNYTSTCIYSLSSIQIIVYLMWEKKNETIQYICIYTVNSSPRQKTQAVFPHRFFSVSICIELSFTLDRPSCPMHADAPPNWREHSVR